MTSRWIVVVLGTLSAGIACGHGPAYRTTGPVIASEGVELSVADQRCTVYRADEKAFEEKASAKTSTPAKQDELQLAMMVQLKNESELPVLLARDRFQLIQEQPANAVTLKSLVSGIVTVLPGETKSVPLAFEHRGSVDCYHDLSLDPANAVQMGGRKIALAPIRFTAVR